MTVDDIGGVLKRIKEKYPSVGAVKRPAGRPFVDYSSHDPEGNIFDIAEPGKKKLVGVFTDAESTKAAPHKALYDPGDESGSAGTILRRCF